MCGPYSIVITLTYTLRKWAARETTSSKVLSERITLVAMRRKIRWLWVPESQVKKSTSEEE